MSALLEAVAQGWGWKLGEPVAIIATNRFGNAIVQNKGGHFFRIMPEEWQCELLACSGDMARQIDSVPDGGSVEIKVTE